MTGRVAHGGWPILVLLGCFLLFFFFLSSFSSSHEDSGESVLFTRQTCRQLVVSFSYILTRIKTKSVMVDLGPSWRRDVGVFSNRSGHTSE